MELLTRKDLAKRWGLSVKTIDNMRRRKEIPWCNLTPGMKRPTVRFILEDVIEHEESGRK